MTTGREHSANAVDTLAEVCALVQRWLDGTEGTYPTHRAMRDLAVLLRLERQRRSRATVRPGA